MAHRLFSFSMYFFGPLWLWMKSWVCVACSGLGFVLVGSGIAADSPCLDHFNFNFYFPFFFLVLHYIGKELLGGGARFSAIKTLHFFFFLSRRGFATFLLLVSVKAGACLHVRFVCLYSRFLHFCISQFASRFASCLCCFIIPPCFHLCLYLQSRCHEVYHLVSFLPFLPRLGRFVRWLKGGTGRDGTGRGK